MFIIGFGLVVIYVLVVVLVMVCCVENCVMYVCVFVLIRFRLWFSCFVLEYCGICLQLIYFRLFGCWFVFFRLSLLC